MGNILRNKKIYNDEVKLNKQYIINCDDDGYILEISDKLINLLEYNIDELKGQFIGKIMSPFLAFLHGKILIPKYKKLTVIQRNAVNMVLSGYKYKRPLVIYTKNKKSIYVYLYLGVNNFFSPSKKEFGTTFIITFDILPEPKNEIVYTHELNIKKNINEFRLSQNKIIVASIDFKDSTKLLVDNGATKMIEIYKKFHNDVVDLIKTYYYPYIYIHEIIGDCFVIMSNIDWAHNMPKYCASLMISFIFKYLYH